MALYCITGKLGSGKTLYSVQRAWRFFRQGRRVVANFPIDFSRKPVPRKLERGHIQVLPDLPTKADLTALGMGGTSEQDSGIIIIDEAARWLNSRDWNGKERSEIIDWLLHSRKLAWDVYLVIQHVGMLDKQVRDGLIEMHTVCRRLDRVKLLGIRLPHIHIATTYYGIHNGVNPPPKAESDWYKPAEFGPCYATGAIFSEARNSYCMLSRWHLVTRMKKPTTYDLRFGWWLFAPLIALFALLSLVTDRIRRLDDCVYQYRPRGSML